MLRSIVTDRKQKLFNACYDFFQSHKHLKETNITALSAITNILADFPDVEDLDLTQREIFYRPYALQLFTQALANNKTLKSLTIRLNVGLRDEATCAEATYIAELLRQNDTLNSLALPDSNLEQDIIPIINALHTNRSLTSLNLYANNIGDEGVPHICSLLKSNNTLCSLDLEGNGIVTKKSLDNLLDAVMINNSMVVLNLKSNRYIMPIWDRIKSKLNENRDRKNDTQNVHIEPRVTEHLSPLTSRVPPQSESVIKSPSAHHISHDVIKPPILPGIVLFNPPDMQAARPKNKADVAQLQNQTQPAAAPQTDDQPVNLLNQPGQTLQDYLASFGKESLSQQMEPLDLSDDVVDQFEDPITFKTMDRPVKLNKKTYDYDSLLALKENNKGQRIVPETNRSFYIIEIAPDWETKEAMIKVIENAKAALVPKIK